MAFQHIGTGTDGIVCKVVAGGLKVGLADDADHRHVAQEGRAGGCQLELDIAVVHLGHRFDGGHVRAQQRGGLGAFKGEDHILRGQGRAVGELDARPQRESVGHAVSADCTACCQLRMID